MKIGPFRIEKEEPPHVLKGLVAGMVAGLLATFLKNRFQAVWNDIATVEQKPRRGPKPRQEEPATIKAATAASRPLLHRELTKKEKELAGPMVDYGFGTLAGGVYGAAAELAPAVTAAGGSGYGAAVWLLGDELAIPAAGLAKWPKHYPAKTHAYALASHVVYGLAMELSRRIVRNSLR